MKLQFRRSSFALLLAILILSGCNLPAAALPPGSDSGQVPEDTAYHTGDTMNYYDISTIVFDEGGPATLGDGSTQNVDPFWMYQNAVTNAQYLLCVEAGACAPPDPKDNPDPSTPNFIGLPVDGITFTQAQSYCTWIGGSLPSEAQFKILAGSVQLPPSPCSEASSCAPASGFSPEFVIPGTDGGGPEAIVLPASGIALKLGENGIILQRGMIPQNVSGRDISLQNGIILRNLSNGDSSQPLMKVYSLDPKATAPGLSFRCIILNPHLFAPQCTITRIPNKDFPPFVCPIPEVSIDVKGSFCSKGTPYFTVDINNADSYDVGFVENAGQGANTGPVDEKIQDCTVDQSTATKTRLVCTGDQGQVLTVYAVENCSAPASFNPDNTCLDGYVYDPTTNMCVYKGQNTSAPTAVGPTQVGGPTAVGGSNNNKTAAISCPTGFTLSPIGCCSAAKDYPAVCPAGFFFSEVSGCSPYSDTVHVIHQDATLPVCTQSGGQNNSSGCTLSCPAGMYPNATCSACTGKP